VIRKFHEWKISSGKREDVPDRHEAKKETPTMGGFVILIATIIPTLLWADLSNYYIWVVTFSLLSFGAIGFMDDVKKLRGLTGKGISGRTKLSLQIFFGLCIGALIFFKYGFVTQLTVPFFKNVRPDLGVFYIALCIFIIAGTSNAVNLTDGLDGLAAGTVMIVMLAFAGIAFMQDNLELALFAASVAGACLGFLWYNSYPADIFMGDTGSLGLGAAIATLGVVTKTELLTPLIGGIYVAEGLSVILQVASYKLTRKRIFRMAPIHHHFEMKGWSETKVMVRFWIVTGILAGAGFALWFVAVRPR
jgi:phospho-N-acetylmuramoyl-pentapeptide-transferase